MGSWAGGRRPDWAAVSDVRVLESILDSASQCIVGVGRDGLVRAVNSRVKEMFGYETEELTGRPVEVLVPVEAAEAHKRHRERFCGEPRVRPIGEGMELTARRKDGSTFPVEISLSYVGQDAEMLVIAFVSDITKRKALEEQLFQAQKLEAVGRLAGGVAHDFNNLLTVILGNNRFLLEQLSTIDPLRGFAEEILRAGERAAALTRQLLAFSRRQMIHPVVVRVDEAIGQSERMMRRLLGEGVEVDCRLRAGPAKVRVDPSQLDQVLLNLLINARDAMGGSGKALVETEVVDLGEEYVRVHFGVKAGRYVQIAVTDTGSGMDSETQRHIFEPFFTTKEAEGGNGLGLATVYGIVKQNGGDIWVYSEVGMGATFKVYLPVVEEERQVERCEAAPAAGGVETVLVVEDEDPVRSVIRRVLEMAGYRVLEAEGPETALELASEHMNEIQLVVTDVVMPRLGGPELVGLLRRGRPGLRALYLSGYTESAVTRRGNLEAGAAFLAKPFQFEQLVRKVREVLDKRDGD